jgi:hypothetical protein
MHKDIVEVNKKMDRAKKVAIPIFAVAMIALGVESA